MSCEKKTERYIRKNFHSKEAIEDVKAMNVAFEKMRNLSCNNPISWYYQGAIHWVPDTIKYNQMCPSYSEPSQLKTAWDNCTHTRDPLEEVHFLTWHRLYIWHMEKIIRKLSGKKDFALPYWGYTDTLNVETNRKMNELFTNPKTALFESARLDSLNNGYPISSEEAVRALSTINLFDHTTYRSFSVAIDNGIHGAMHDYIGGGEDTTKTYYNKILQAETPTGLMGWVPTAGFDPIFFVHHSNIDRLWAQWTNSHNGQNLSLEELKQYDWSYTFFDENGKEVKYTAEDVFDIIYDLDYDFDDTKVKRSENPKKFLVKSTQPRELSVGKKITSPLTEISLPKSSIKNGSKVSITLSFLNVPRGVYEVYLNSDPTPHPSEESLLGHISFFGSDHKVAGQTCIRGCCGTIINGRVQRTFTYEVTNSQITDAVTMTIVKWNKQLHKDLVVEKIVIE